jgi:hypothetical protein
MRHHNRARIVTIDQQGLDHKKSHKVGKDGLFTKVENSLVSSQPAVAPKKPSKQEEKITVEEKATVEQVLVENVEETIVETISSTEELHEEKVEQGFSIPGTAQKISNIEFSEDSNKDAQSKKKSKQKSKI